MSSTTDPTDPRLTRGVDSEPRSQAEVYLTLSEEERAKGFVKPCWDRYVHLPCKKVTTMAKDISETYAANPGFYGATYCTECRMHRPVGEHGEFEWPDGSKVGT
jgi:hypothetical protein